MLHDQLGRFRDIYEPARLAADVADAMARGALASDMMAANGAGLLADALKLQDPLRHLAQDRIALARVLEAAGGVDRSASAFAAAEVARMSAYAHAEREVEFARRTDPLFGRGVGLSAHDLFFARTAAEVHAAEAWRIAEVQAQARAAQALCLPSVLEAYRTSTDALSLKLLGLSAIDSASAAANLGAFAQSSAMADLISSSLRVDRKLLAASRAYALEAPPLLASLAEHRSFLDAAGLTLPRWPRLRLLSAAEKRRRMRDHLKSNAEPTHVKRAKSLVHRYELTLRDIVDGAMVEAYGENWARDRLEACGCKDLLGKWLSRGGAVLDHADYHHYGKIMGDTQHFSEVFEAGFDDPKALKALLTKAGRLRAASHHGRPFTPEDLRDLRLTWATLTTGLLALTPDHELESL